MDNGIEYLRGKLAQKAVRVDLRYQYYEMKNKMRKVSALIPIPVRLGTLYRIMGMSTRSAT